MNLKELFNTITNCISIKKSTFPKKCGWWLVIPSMLLIIGFISLSRIIPLKADIASMELKKRILVFSLFMFSLGFILSMVSFCKIKFSKENIKKTYLCPAILGFFSVFFLVITTGLIWAVGTAIYHEKSVKIREGHTHIVQLGEALIQYAKNNNDTLPEANQWCDLLIKNFKNISPETFLGSFESNGICDFAYNKNVAGLPLADTPGNVVLLFEADGGWNLNGGEELLGTKHKEYQSLVLFTDRQWGMYDSFLGTVKYCVSDKYDYNPIRWDP
ncbi:MAG: hypothetical protein JXB49_28385 [Bacteroidales bacterium]|nr:hypothetical protein [Bacteroidales bacterium]